MFETSRDRLKEIAHRCHDEITLFIEDRKHRRLQIAAAHVEYFTRKICGSVRDHNISRFNYNLRQLTTTLGQPITNYDRRAGTVSDDTAAMLYVPDNDTVGYASRQPSGKIVFAVYPRYERSFKGTAEAFTQRPGTGEQDFSFVCEAFNQLMAGPKLPVLTDVLIDDPQLRQVLRQPSRVRSSIISRITYVMGGGVG